jgi:hypothetical protein
MRRVRPRARVLRTPRDDSATRQVPNSKLGGHALDTATLATVDELIVRTVRGDGSWATRPIWFVIVDGQLYVRSAYGQHGAWYQIARRDGAVDVQVIDVGIRARLEPMHEKDRNARISVAYERKYGRRWPGPTQTMLSDVASETTMSLILSRQVTVDPAVVDLADTRGAPSVRP